MSPRRKSQQNTAKRQRRPVASHGVDTGGSAKREAAILALLEHRTLGEAAAHCGVSERTLVRWTTEDEAFKRDLAAARRTVYAAGIAQLQALTGKAIVALEDCLGSSNQSVKIAAARTVLEHGRSQYETEEIIAKLAEIETQLAVQHPGGGR